MKILITGSRGWVGRWLVPELEHLDHEVFATSRLDFDVCNTKQMRRVLLDTEPDYVIHLAAATGRELAVDLEQVCRTNVVATGELARLCEDLGICFVYASSSEVYGDLGGEPCTEKSSPGRIHNLYGLSKWQGEQIASLYYPDPLILRFVMPYGPGFPGTSMYPGRGKNALINFLWKALDEEVIEVHRGAKRSWVWVEDLCSAIGLLVDSGSTGVYNVGSDHDLQQMHYVAYLAYHLAGTKEQIREVDSPSNVTPIKSISTKKLQAKGWAPTVTLEEGMQQTLDWLQTIRSSPAGANLSLLSR